MRKGGITKPFQKKNIYTKFDTKIGMGNIIPPNLGKKIIISNQLHPQKIDFGPIALAFKMKTSVGYKTCYELVTNSAFLEMYGKTANEKDFGKQKTTHIKYAILNDGSTFNFKQNPIADLSSTVIFTTSSGLFVRTGITFYYEIIFPGASVNGNIRIENFENEENVPIPKQTWHSYDPRISHIVKIGDKKVAEIHSTPFTRKVCSSINWLAGPQITQYELEFNHLIIC